MELDQIIVLAESTGCPIVRTGPDSVLTKRGSAKVIVHPRHGQAHCHPYAGDITIYGENPHPEEDLLHEMEHFQISPVDLQVFCVLDLVAIVLVFRTMLAAQGWPTACLAIVMLLYWTYIGGYNLFSDLVIDARRLTGIRQSSFHALAKTTSHKPARE